NDNFFPDNTISGGAGIIIYPGAKENHVAGGTIDGASVGVEDHGTASSVKFVTFTNNTVGIKVEGGHGGTIDENTFTGNGSGIQLINSSGTVISGSAAHPQVIGDSTGD